MRLLRVHLTLRQASPQGHKGEGSQVNSGPVFIRFHFFGPHLTLISFHFLADKAKNIYITRAMLHFTPRHCIIIFHPLLTLPCHLAFFLFHPGHHTSSGSAAPPLPPRVTSAAPLSRPVSIIWDERYRDQGSRLRKCESRSEEREGEGEGRN